MMTNIRPLPGFEPGNWLQTPVDTNEPSETAYLAQSLFENGQVDKELFTYHKTVHKLTV